MLYTKAMPSMFFPLPCPIPLTTEPHWLIEVARVQAQYEDPFNKSMAVISMALEQFERHREANRELARQRYENHR